MPEVELLTCGCCGRYFHGVYDGSGDIGFGTCESCMKWTLELFFNTRIKLLSKSLNDTNRVKFDSMPRDHQEALIIKAIEEGVMV